MDLGDFGGKAILTGAGFSANFGGYLASEFVDRLLLDVRIANNPEHLRRLKESCDFELAYSNLFEGNGASPCEYRQSVLEVFQEMDADMSRAWLSPDKPCLNRLVELLQQLWGPGDMRKFHSSFMFTANQDLFIERHANLLPPLCRPGFPSGEFYRNLSNAPFSLNGFEEVPSEVDRLDLVGHFNYIKLHGSFNWVTDLNEPVLALGIRKTEIQRRFPILSLYWDAFERVLCSGDLKLLVIGYGFGDDHINQALLKAVKEHGLRIYLANKMDLAGTKKFLQDKIPGKHRDIFDGICANLPGTFQDHIPKKEHKSPLWDKFWRNFLTN